jgi:hypothetical protein
VRTVIFSAKDKAVHVNIDGEDYGYAFWDWQLCELLIEADVQRSDDFYNSSTMDHAMEAGFYGDNHAHEMVESALQVMFFTGKPQTNNLVNNEKNA